MEGSNLVAGTAELGDWSNPLCGCFSDCTTCILAFLIPCYVFGENAEHIGEDKLLCGLAALGALLFFPFGYVLLRIYLRSRIRLQKGISGNLCLDCCTIYFCDLCALVQESRELKSPSALSMERK